MATATTSDNRPVPAARNASTAAPGRRLLLLCTGTRVGGMERVALTLARGLAARGWDVRSVFPAGPDVEALRDWVAAEDVHAEFHPALLHLGQERGLQDVRALRSLVRASDCDVVNLHYGANHISLKDVAAVRLAGRRCVASVHHPTAWSEANAHARRSTGWGGRLSRRVVVNSSATQQVALAAGVPSARLVLAPCGVRPPRRVWTRAAARVALGLPEDALIVGTLARLVPEKRVDLLVDAIARMQGTEAAPTLLVAGDGPERAALEGYAAALLPGRAVFLGRVPDPEPVYAAMDVFSLPSDLEGFGLVFLEAALQGVPSVGTHVGGVPDAIEDGASGVLVPPGNVEALTEALEGLLADRTRREALGKHARQRAREVLTEEAMVDAYERALLA